jgi:S-DNA-T family DNA segregation ATPase FtsK/SpoIIIE
VATRRAQAGPATSYALVIAAGAVVAGGVATYFSVPGAPIVWLALIVAGWLEQMPPFTGKKDQRGYPTPAHPGEQKAMNTFRFYKDLRWRLISPTTDWLPGWPVLGSWLAALMFAALCSFAPVRADLPASLVWVNMACGFIVVAQVFASRRRTVAESDPCPGARVDSVPALLADRKEAISLGAALVAAVGAVAYTGATLVPKWVTLTGPLGSISPWAFGVVTSLLVAGAVVAHPLQASALATWRELVVVRGQWSPRWLMLKMDPAPYLVAHTTVGAATVDTFEAPAALGASAFYQLAGKITPTLGTNMQVAVLEVPNADGQGQPVPGTCHPLRFEVIMWPADQIPSVTEPGADQALVTLLIRCAMSWAADGAGFGRLILTGCDLVTEPAAAGVWATQWVPAGGVDLGYVRTGARGAISSYLGADVLVDHRAMGGAGLLFVGPALDPNAVFDPDSGLTVKSMAWIATEDEWRRRWAGTLKQDVNAPVPQPDVTAQSDLADGTTVYYQPFVTLTGEDPAQFMTGLEGKMAATIPGSAPFVSIARYSNRVASRAGERHTQAITVAHAMKPVPPVNKMGPVRGDAPRWVLAGHINTAFTAARLTRPEVLSVQCLTTERSREHIWQITVRLFDVTLSDVRGAAARIRGSLGAGIWLRIASHPDGCVIFAGGQPSKVRLAKPERDTARLVALDWEQAWLDSKVSGVNAQLPSLTNVGTLPKNCQVQVLDFDLPPGLALSDVKGAAERLKTATGNAFVDVRTGVGGASTVRLLVCEVNPLPDHAPYDFAEIDAATGIPFATGIDGDAIAYNPRVDPHLLVAGASNGGKSVVLQAIIYGALVRGWDLYVADPTKGAADFRFAEPYAKAVTIDPFEAAAMMKAVYKEVVRRKNLNSQHAVGNYRLLPDDVRPPHMLVVIDEFTSLMGADPVPKPSDDPAMDYERDLIIATNQAKSEIGVFAGKCAREARSAGLTLVLATQKLSAKLLDTIPGAGDLKVNLSRMLLGKTTNGDRMSALRAPFEAPDLGDAVPPGRGLWETTEGAAKIMQGWYEPREQALLSEELAKRVAPLTDSQKIDLTPFIVKVPQPEGFEDQQPRPAPSSEPVVVELEDFEMSLDDLEMTLDDLDTASTELPAWAAEFAATQHREDQAALDEPLAGVQDNLPAPAGTVGFGSALGPDGVILAPTGTDNFGWWKVDAILAWLDAHPDVDRLVFADGELDDDDDLDTPHREVLEEVLDARGIEHLLLVVDDETLTVDDLAQVQEFLGESGAQAEDAGDARPAVLVAALLDDGFDAPVSMPALFDPEPAPPVVPVGRTPESAAVSDWDAEPAPRAATAPLRLTAPVEAEW